MTIDTLFEARQSSTPLVDLESFHRLHGAARDAAFLDVDREVRRLEALRAAMITDTVGTLAYQHDAHHSPKSWVSAVVNCNPGTAGKLVRRASVLADLPAVAAMLADGSIGVDQVDLLAALHRNPRCRDLLPESEELLLGLAIGLPITDFAVVCRRWEAHADPDGAERSHARARDERSLSAYHDGATFRLTVNGDALSGEMFMQILREHAECELNNDIAERLARYGPDAELHPLARTHAQRMYDAMIAMGFKAAAVTDPTSREPLVVIHCTPHVLEAAIRDYVSGTREMPGDEDSDRMRMCETSSGAQVSMTDLAVAAMIGQIQRIVTNPDGHAIHLGRKARLFSGPSRQAVLLTGDRCCWPGCGIRTGRIEIDHMIPWAALLGRTDPDNGAPICGVHNRAKHNNRTTVHRDANGWHHHRPDGTEIAPRCPGGR